MFSLYVYTGVLIVTFNVYILLKGGKKNGK